jgi:hypothetical protein
MNTYEVINWSKTKFLSWTDFKSELNPSSFEDAHSTIRYRYTWTVKSIDIEGKIHFFIENIQLIVEFFPLLSWVRTSHVNLNLLKHEQGHFDLAELLRPKITQNLQNAFANKKFLVRGQVEEQQKQFARYFSNVLISKEFEKWEKYMSKKQDEYDKQTNYGQLKEKQLEYDNKFKELRQY